MDASDFNKFKDLMIKLAQNCTTTVPKDSLDWRFKRLHEYTVREVEKGINHLIDSREASKFPTHGEMVKFIREAKRGIGYGLALSPCPRCSPSPDEAGLGWLFVVQDGCRIAIKCGCTNSPAWGPEETYQGLQRDGKLDPMTTFNSKGKFMHESWENFFKRKKEESENLVVQKSIFLDVMKNLRARLRQDTPF